MSGIAATDARIEELCGDLGIESTPAG